MDSTVYCSIFLDYSKQYVIISVQPHTKPNEPTFFSCPFSSAVVTPRFSGGRDFCQTIFVFIFLSVFSLTKRPDEVAMRRAQSVNNSVRPPYFSVVAKVSHIFFLIAAAPLKENGMLIMSIFIPREHSEDGEITRQLARANHN